MLGYKIMRYDMTCFDDFQYEVGQTYKKESTELKPMSNTVFHFCKQLQYVFDYYSYLHCRIFVVESGDMYHGFNSDRLFVTNELTVVRELSTQEIVDLLTQEKQRFEKQLRRFQYQFALDFFNKKLDFELLVKDGKKDVFVDKLFTLPIDAKIAAIQVLKSIGDLDNIKRLVGETNNNVRLHVIQALEQLGDLKTLNSHVFVLDYFSQVQLIKSIGNLGDVKSVHEWLYNPSWQIRIQVIKSLTKLGDLEHIQCLVDDDDYHVRITVIKALEKLGDIETIRTMTDDDDSQVSDFAKQALQRLEQ